MVDALRSTYTLSELLGQLGLPRSSYFYHRALRDAADRYVEVRRTIADAFERNYRCYGYRRIRASLSKQSASISEKVVQRLIGLAEAHDRCKAGPLDVMQGALTRQCRM